VLKKQPYGYDKTLGRTPKITEIEVEKKNNKVYVKFDNEHPICIGEEDSNMSKLFLSLNDAIGSYRSFDSIIERLGPRAYESTIKNAVRELRRKLAEEGKRNVLSFSFKGKTVCMKIKSV